MCFFPLLSFIFIHFVFFLLSPCLRWPVWNLVHFGYLHHCLPPTPSFLPSKPFASHCHSSFSILHLTLDSFLTTIAFFRSQPSVFLCPMLSLSILSGQVPTITPLTPVSICTSSDYGTPSFSPLLPCKSLPISISPDPQSLLWTPPISPIASPDTKFGFVNGNQEKPLDVNDRTKMAWLMDLRTSESDTIKAAEIVLELFPPADMDLSEVSVGAYVTDLSEALRYWTSLTPHPYCILILTVCLLERFKAAHPSLIASGRISDTTLRVVFAAFLLTAKHVSEDSFHNTAFVSRTPWTCGEINSIEKELFARLDYNIYVSADEFLNRVVSFDSEP